MQEDAKKEELIDVGEKEGAEINLDQDNEQTEEAVAEEKVEETKQEETPVEEKAVGEKKDDKEDELKAYSDGVQKRIAKLTRKMREAERQREEAIGFAQHAKKERDELQGRFSKLDKSYVSEFENRVKTNMDAARQALKTAIEAQDVEGQVRAQEQMATLTADAARLASLKSIQQEQPKEIEKEINITPQRSAYEAPATDPKAEVWASKNAWFGNDSAMTYTAFDLHKKLVEEEGFDPKSDEYYSEIDKRIRLDFPHKFDKMPGNTIERAKPAQTVASANRPSMTGRKKTVRLTPSQVAIAKRLGVPLEEYAKQLTMKEA